MTGGDAYKLNEALKAGKNIAYARSLKEKEDELKKSKENLLHKEQEQRTNLDGMLGKLDITKIQIEKLKKEVESDFAIAKLYEDKKEQVKSLSAEAEKKDLMQKELFQEQTKKEKALRRAFIFGALKGTRTPGLLIRSQTLYPAELPARLKEV